MCYTWVTPGTAHFSCICNTYITDMKVFPSDFIILNNKISYKILYYKSTGVCDSGSQHRLCLVKLTCKFLFGPGISLCFTILDVSISCLPEICTSEWFLWQSTILTPACSHIFSSSDRETGFSAVDHLLTMMCVLSLNTSLCLLCF